MQALAHDRGVSVGRLLADFAAQSMNSGCPTCGRPWIEPETPDLAEIPVETPLVAEARASIALDGETRSFPDCPHRRKVSLNGGMAKCADCGWIRRNDGRWYSV